MKLKKKKSFESVQDFKTEEASAFYEKNPEAAAVSRKFIRSNREPQTSLLQQNFDALRESSDKVARNVDDATNTMENLPDLKLAMRIQVSSILAPNDLTSCKLTYDIKNLNLPSELINKVKDYLSEIATNDYKIEEMCPSLLENALFMRGSDPIMVLPESSLDYLINGKSKASLENFNYIKTEFDSNNILRPLGYLGEEEANSKDNDLSLESFLLGNSPNINKFNSKISDLIYITDNYSTLKLPILHEKVRKLKVRDRIKGTRASFENRKDFIDFKSNLYQTSRTNGEILTMMPTGSETGRGNVGHPTVIRLPPESVIPIHSPGDPSNHIGYFILLDRFGNPVNKTSDSDNYEEIVNQFKNAKNDKSGASGIIDQINTMANGALAFGSEMPTNEQIIKMHNEILIGKLEAKLFNGINGKNVKISETEEASKIMFARVLSNKMTQIVYVPAELMTYVAFFYNKDGTGRSYLDSTKNISSLRMVLQLANALAVLKNSTSKTRLNIKFDEEDVDPAGTKAMILDDHIRATHLQLPIGATRLGDILDGLRAGSIEVTTEGSQYYPDMTISSEDVQSARVQPDSEFADTLRDQQLMGFEMQPNIVDASKDIDFAAQQLTSNLLYTKSIREKQIRFGYFLSDLIKKFAWESGIVRKELNSYVEEFKDSLDTEFEELTTDEIVDEILEHLDITLPEPDTTKIKSQVEALDNYKEGLDKFLQDVITQEALQQAGVQIDDVETYRNNFKSKLICDYMRSNNIFPEFFDMIESYNEESGTLNGVTEYLEHLSKAVKFIKAYEDSKGAGEEEETNSWDSSGDTSSDDFEDTETTEGSETEENFDDFDDLEDLDKGL